MPKKTPGPPAGQARPRKTFLVHSWPPARHQASPPMPPAPKALEMSDKLIDAQIGIFPELKLTHLIPRHRVSRDYFLRLVEGTYISNFLLDYKWRRVIPQLVLLRHRIGVVWVVLRGALQQ